VNLIYALLLSTVQAYEIYFKYNDHQLDGRVIAGCWTVLSMVHT